MSEHRFEPDGTAASGDEASLVEPQGVNAEPAEGRAGDPVATDAGSERVRGRHLARNLPTPDDLDDNGSQTPAEGGDLLGAPSPEPSPGQDSGKID
jgi:hypothetical protein